MNGFLKALITLSMLSVGQLVSAGPLDKFMKRQDTLSSDDAITSTISTDSTSPTISLDNPSTTFGDGTLQSTPTTNEVPNSSFTPFTGTFASALPAVTEIDSWMSEHPDMHTRTFPVPTETTVPGMGGGCGHGGHGGYGGYGGYGHGGCTVTVTTTVYMPCGTSTDYPITTPTYIYPSGTDSILRGTLSTVSPIASDTDTIIFPTPTDTSDAIFPTPTDSVSTFPSGSDTTFDPNSTLPITTDTDSTGSDIPTPSIVEPTSDATGFSDVPPEATGTPGASSTDV